MSVGKLSPHPCPGHRVLEACWTLSKASKQQTDLLDMRVHTGCSGKHKLSSDQRTGQASLYAFPDSTPVFRNMT